MSGPAASVALCHVDPWRTDGHVCRPGVRCRPQVDVRAVEHRVGDLTLEYRVAGEVDRGRRR